MCVCLSRFKSKFLHHCFFDFLFFANRQNTVASIRSSSSINTNLQTELQFEEIQQQFVLTHTLENQTDTAWWRARQWPFGNCQRQMERHQMELLHSEASWMAVYTTTQKSIIKTAMGRRLRSSRHYSQKWESWMDVRQLYLRNLIIYLRM